MRRRRRTSLVDAAARELGYASPGHLVTHATWNDFSLKEGLAICLDRLIMEELFMEELFMQELFGRELAKRIDESFPWAK